MSNKKLIEKIKTIICNSSIDIQSILNTKEKSFLSGLKSDFRYTHDSRLIATIFFTIGFLIFGDLLTAFGRLQHTFFLT